MFIEPAV